MAVRVWPASDYTRVTLELDQPLKFSQTMIADPSRLVVDLEGLDVDDGLRELVAKVRADDPYIRQVRVGQFRPQVMRLGFDLKADVAPQIVTLAPVAQDRHPAARQCQRRPAVGPAGQPRPRRRDRAGPRHQRSRCR